MDNSDSLNPNSKNVTHGLLPQGLVLPMLCLCDYQEAAVSAQRPGVGGNMGLVFPHNVLFVSGNLHFIIQKICFTSM